MQQQLARLLARPPRTLVACRHTSLRFRPASPCLQAVQEGMDSRVYAGVHFRRAVNVGKDIGVSVAQFVWNAGPPAVTVDD